ncbi:MAG TPA: dihydropteroate synthase [Mycobacteriales bacterium]|nr:dihydropteroate synthase [Mycobacteriales bacterium]
MVGVLNITPDSFSDGGRYADLDAALTHGLRMWGEGADLIDVGGESTRPGADRVDSAEETRRVLPTIRELAAAGVRLSVDTSRAAVAEAALAAGAQVVNDVSGGLADPDMCRVVADAGVPWILMHWRGHSRDMRKLANYADVVDEVVAELSQRIDAALAAGVAPDRLAVDPGLGFAKTAAHNWALLDRLDALLGLGYPVLVATSRKSFLGSLLADPDGPPRPVAEREDATVATTALAAAAGVWGVRVHRVRANLDAVRVAAAWRAAGGTGSAGPAAPTAPARGTGATGATGTAGPAGPAGAAGAAWLGEVWT